MRNTAEYEDYLTNPLEDRYPGEPEVRCDVCAEPRGEQDWCGECGCCQIHCRLFESCDTPAHSRRDSRRWEHNCDECRYQDKVGEHDAYFCNADGIPVMIYRYGEGEEDILYSEIRTPKIIVDLGQGFEYAWEDIAAIFGYWSPTEGVHAIDHRPLNERDH